MGEPWFPPCSIETVASRNSPATSAGWRWSIATALFMAMIASSVSFSETAFAASSRSLP